MIGENLISTAEIAKRVNMSERQIRRLAPKLPGRVPPYRVPGKGYWFEAKFIEPWIAKNMVPADSRHRLGRKRRKPAASPGKQWRDAMPRLEDYSLWRSTRRQGFKQFIACLNDFADAAERLPDILKTRAKRLRFQSEYDQTMGALFRIDKACDGRLAIYKFAALVPRA